MIEKRQLEKVSVTRLAGLCRVIAANAAKKQGSRRTGTPTRVGMGSASTNRAHVQGVARTSLEDKGIGHQNGGIAVQYLNLSSPPESHTTSFCLRLHPVTCCSRVRNTFRPQDTKAGRPPPRKPCSHICDFLATPKVLHKPEDFNYAKVVLSLQL